MRRSARRSSPHSTSIRKVGRTLRRGWGNLAFALLALAVLFALGGLGLTIRHSSLAIASGKGLGTSAANVASPVAKPTCGDSGLPACKPQVTWIHINSQASSDLIAGARQSPLFTVDRSGGGDYVNDLSHLGTPVFVRALQTQGGATYPDFYVIPIHDGNGATMAAAELELDAARQNIHVIAIVTYTHPHEDGGIARTRMQDAVRAVAAQQHAALRADAQPQLVYFPVDAYAQQSGKITWVAGGEFPADPVWLVPGADGRDHIVGTDGRAYYSSELPAPPLG